MNAFKIDLPLRQHQRQRRSHLQASWANHSVYHSVYHVSRTILSACLRDFSVRPSSRWLHSREVGCMIALYRHRRGYVNRDMKANAIFA